VIQCNTITGLIRESVSAWNDDDAPRLAAALAFYTLLSLSPILIVIVGVAGLVFGKAAASGQLAWQIHDLVGWDEARMFQSVVQEATRAHHATFLAAALSILTLLFGASSVVVELRSGLNTIWHIAPAGNSSGLKAILKLGKERLYSIALIIGAGFLLLLSVAASAGIAALSRILGPNFPIPEAWLHVATFVASFLVIAVLFATIYRVMPDVELEWADVAVGACVTALIFTIGKQLIALYLAKAAFASTFGAAGSFVILLVWVYYSAQLFFLGAEFTKIYAAKYSSQKRRLPQVLPVPPPEGK
jgi:membrane protein